jgi:hypothetical protein
MTAVTGTRSPETGSDTELPEWHQDGVIDIVPPSGRRPVGRAAVAAPSAAGKAFLRSKHRAVGPAGVEAEFERKAVRNWAERSTT